MDYPKTKGIPLSLFLSNTILDRWKIYQKNEFCCEILRDERKIAHICLKIFDDYPALKSNNWSWGEENVTTKKLKNLTQNGSRRIIGKIESISIHSLGGAEKTEMKKILFDLARAIA